MSLEVMTKVLDLEEISQRGGKSVKRNEGQQQNPLDKADIEA